MIIAKQARVGRGGAWCRINIKWWTEKREVGITNEINWNVKNCGPWAWGESICQGISFSFFHYLPLSYITSLFLSLPPFFFHYIPLLFSLHLSFFHYVPLFVISPSSPFTFCGSPFLLGTTGRFNLVIHAFSMNFQGQYKRQSYKEGFSEIVQGDKGGACSVWRDWRISSILSCPDDSRIQNGGACSAVTKIKWMTVMPSVRVRVYTGLGLKLDDE